jgi:hypothetical protein
VNPWTPSQRTSRAPSSDRPAGSRRPTGTPEPERPGVRHAALLVLCVLGPVTYSVAAAARIRVEGFPLWSLVLLTGVVGVGSGLLGVVAEKPGISGIASRVVGAAVLAFGVRMTVPSPSRALAEIREGDAYLVSGSVLVLFLLLLLASAVGHLVTTRVVAIAKGQPTTDAARADDQQLLVSAWGTALAMLVLAGLTHRASGGVGQVLLVAALVVALVAIADLRGRIPPPGATRPAIVAAPRAVRSVGIAMAVAAAAAVTALAAPALPDGLSEGLGRPSEWLAQTDLDWDPQRAPGYDPEGDRLTIHGREDLAPRRIPFLPDPRQLAVPRWVQSVIIAAGVLLLLFVLRPERWLATARRLWAALRGSGWHEEGEVFDALRPLEEAGEDGDGRRGRFRDAFERVRPRPRDPRAAIVHDYLRAERALARGELGRWTTETPLEHVRRLEGEGRVAGLAPLAELARLVSTARYGRSEPPAAAVERSRELQQQLDHELRDHR